jgi:hypothetical protein
MALSLIKERITMSDDLVNMSLENLALYTGRGQPGSMHDQQGRAEFLRRQTQAIQDTATATKKYTLYMLLSVILMSLSVAGTLVLAYMNYIAQRPSSRSASLARGCRRVCWPGLRTPL